MWESVSVVNERDARVSVPDAQRMRGEERILVVVLANG